MHASPELCSMELLNRTEVSEFFLKGFSGYPALEHLLFAVCSAMYLVTLLGNTAIVTVSVLDPRLHTPMYFFLGNLSILDICYTSTFVPLMLVHLLSIRKTISFAGCALQMCLSLTTGSTECLLLAIMAFDRYLAICQPLRYPVLMSHRLCLLLAGAAWVFCLFKSVTESVIAMRLPFCGHHVVSHFTCEILAVLKLVCGDTSLSETLLLVGAILLLPVPLTLICLSYTLILATILRVPSASGRRKAFSTCSAHLAVVMLFYGTVIFMYMKPKSKEAHISDEVFTVLYAVVTPMLNPIIYSLRNKEVKEAAKKVLGRRQSSKFLGSRPAARPPSGPEGEGGDEMDGANHTRATEYVLLGLYDHHDLELVLFVFCLAVYSVNVLGNSLLIVLSLLDPHLHSPMYFFLSNLSLLDICGTSSFVPLMLVNFLKAQKTISFPGCALQMYLTLGMGAAECLLLAVMAYDRYVAICQPLRYSELMNRQMCVQMAALSWGAAFANSMLQSIFTWRLPFCGHNVLNHFFCELLAILKLACGDISLNAQLIVVATIVLTLSPLLLICLSYILILATILRVPSAAGRRKAFSTCSAHLTVVVIFYGSIAFMYCKPKAKDLHWDKIIALFYGIVTPSLNPIIYSLRNAEVKAAARALLQGDLLSRKLSHLVCCSPALSG
ncbi:Olfactory receptor 13J1 [Galemys pyrenaicus]|uniref:Olfactory receptor 13J1 n=1 Tax=Galemys pyrenaicus TaxID=202257 RepID=A0A8J5ZS32_GALPY|nr:Olfactory receptor 13J1 [Galemys pyrenaicus]